MKKRRALVTGGTRGIGRAIVDKLRQADIETAVTGTKPDTDVPSGTTYYSCDFTDPLALEDFCRQIANENFDILVNNAGINRVESFEGYPLGDFKALQQVNVTAPFQICQAVLPGMRRRQYGRIVNITSVFGVVSKEHRSAYSASKFGLLGLSKSLALETAKDNVLINCVAPGFVDTELTRKILGPKGVEKMLERIPIGRLAKPEEIAEWVLFLASEKNSYMTGQNIIVDGGFVSE